MKYIEEGGYSFKKELYIYLKRQGNLHRKLNGLIFLSL